MLVVDTERHELLHDEDVKRPLFGRQPYGEWLEEGEIHLNELPDPDAGPASRTVQPLASASGLSGTR